MTDKEFLKDIYNPYKSDGTGTGDHEKIRYIFSEALHSDNRAKILDKEKLLNEKIEIANASQCFFEGDYIKSSSFNSLTLQQKNTINELMSYCYMFTNALPVEQADKEKAVVPAAQAKLPAKFSLNPNPPLFEFRKEFYKKATPFSRNHPQNILRLFGSVYHELSKGYMLIGNKKVKTGEAVNQAENYLFSEGMMINFEKTPVFKSTNTWKKNGDSLFNFAVKFKHPKTKKNTSINIEIENSEEYARSVAKRQLRRLSAAVGAKWHRDDSTLDKTFILEDFETDIRCPNAGEFTFDGHTYKQKGDLCAWKDSGGFKKLVDHKHNIDMSLNDEIFPGIDKKKVALRVAKITDDNGVILSYGATADFIKISNIPDETYNERDDDDSFVFTGQIPTIGDLYRYATTTTQELSYKDTKLRFKVKEEETGTNKVFEMNQNGCFGEKPIDADGFATGEFERFKGMTLNLAEIIKDDKDETEFLKIEFDESYNFKQSTAVRKFIDEKEKELKVMHRKRKAKKKGQGAGIVNPEISGTEIIKFEDEFGVEQSNARFVISDISWEGETQGENFGWRGLLNLGIDSKYNIRSIVQLNRIMRGIKKYDSSGNLVPRYSTDKKKKFYDILEEFIKPRSISVDRSSAEDKATLDAQRATWINNVDKMYNRSFSENAFVNQAKFKNAFLQYISEPHYTKFLESLGTGFDEITERGRNFYKTQLMVREGEGWVPAQLAPGDAKYTLALKLIDEQLKKRGHPPVGKDFKTLPAEEKEKKKEKEYGILYSGKLYSLNFNPARNEYYKKKTYTVGGVIITEDEEETGEQGGKKYIINGQMGYVKFKESVHQFKGAGHQFKESVHQIIINEHTPPALTLTLKKKMPSEHEKEINNLKKEDEDMAAWLLLHVDPPQPSSTITELITVDPPQPSSTITELINLSNLLNGDGPQAGFKIGSRFGLKDTKTLTPDEFKDLWQRRFDDDNAGKGQLERWKEGLVDAVKRTDDDVPEDYEMLKKYYKDHATTVKNEIATVNAEFSEGMGSKEVSTARWKDDKLQLGFEAAEVKGTNLFGAMMKGLKGMMQSENSAHMHDNEFVPMNKWYDTLTGEIKEWQSEGFTRNITMSFENTNLKCVKQEVSWDHDATKRSNSKIHYLFMLNQYIYVCLYQLSTEYIEKNTQTGGAPSVYKTKSNKYNELSDIWKFFENAREETFEIEIVEGEEKLEITYDELQNLFNFGFEFAEIYPKKTTKKKTYTVKSSDSPEPNYSTKVDFNVDDAPEGLAKMSTFYEQHFVYIKTRIKQKLNDDLDVKYTAKLYTIYTRRYVCVYDKNAPEKPSVYFRANIDEEMVDGEWQLVSIVDWGEKGLILTVEQKKIIFLVYKSKEPNFGQTIKNKLTAYQFTIEDARILTTENKHEFFLFQLLTKMGVLENADITIDIIKGGKSVPIENKNEILSGFIKKLGEDITKQFSTPGDSTSGDSTSVKFIPIVMMVVQLMFFTLLHGNNYMDYDVLSIEQFLDACDYFGGKVLNPKDKIEKIQNYIKVGDATYWGKMCATEKDAIRNIVMSTPDETDVHKLLKDRKTYCSNLESDIKARFMDEHFIPHISEARTWKDLDASPDRKETAAGSQITGQVKSTYKYYLYQDLINYMKYITIKNILPINHRFDCFFDKFCYLCSQIVKDHVVGESIFFNEEMQKNFKGAAVSDNSSSSNSSSISGIGSGTIGSGIGSVSGGGSGGSK